MQHEHQKGNVSLQSKFIHYVNAIEKFKSRLKSRLISSKFSRKSRLNFLSKNALNKGDLKGSHL